MKRQGLIVTIGGLRDLAWDLENELIMRNPPGFFKNHDELWNQGVQVAIVNRSGASDGWIIEKSKK